MKHLAKRVIGGATALAVLALILGAVAVSDTGTAQAFTPGAVAGTGAVAPSEPPPPGCQYIATQGGGRSRAATTVWVGVCAPPIGTFGTVPGGSSNFGATANAGYFAKPGLEPSGGNASRRR